MKSSPSFKSACFAFFCGATTLFFGSAGVPRAAVFDANGIEIPQPVPGSAGLRDTTGWEQKFDIAKLDLLIGTARAYFDKGEYLSSIDTLKKADALSPFNPAIQMALMQCHIARDELLDAIRYGLNVIEVAPHFDLGYTTLGYCYLTVEDMQGAVNTYEKFIRNQPTNPQAYSGLALVRAMQGRDDEAEILFRQALDINAEDGYTLEMMGNLYQRKNNHAKAIEHYNRALTSRDGEFELHNALATSLFVLGRKKEAIDHYQKALKINPQFAKPYRNLTLLLLDEGRPQEAIPVALSALKMEFSSGTAWRNYIFSILATLEKPADWKMPVPPSSLEEKDHAAWFHREGLRYLQITNTVAAAHLFGEAVMRDPAAPAYYNDFGALISSAVSMDLGVPFFVAAGMVGSGDPSARLNLKTSLEDINIRNRQMRIMELSEGVKKEPENGLYHFELALLLAEFNRVTNAIPHFAEAVKLLPKETRPKVDYAQALYITGDPDGAIRQVNEALKLDNENPLIQHRLAWLLLNKPDADSLHFTFARDLLIKANEATNYLELNFLRNLAQAYFRNKEYRDASHIGRMALERAEDIGMVEFADTLRKELTSYEAALIR